jgi:hypothetical protein
MDNNFREEFARMQTEIEKRGLRICKRIEENQHILDKRLGNNDISYFTYLQKTDWNNELAAFMTVLNCYREMADYMFTELIM